MHFAVGCLCSSIILVIKHPCGEARQEDRATAAHASTPILTEAIHQQYPRRRVPQWRTRARRTGGHSCRFQTQKSIRRRQKRAYARECAGQLRRRQKTFMMPQRRISRSQIHMLMPQWRISRSQLHMSMPQWRIRHPRQHMWHPSLSPHPHI